MIETFQDIYSFIGLLIGSLVFMVALGYAAYLFVEEPATRWEIGDEGKFYKAEAGEGGISAYVLIGLVIGIVSLFFWLPILVGGFIYGVLRVIRAIRRIQKRLKETA